MAMLNNHRVYTNMIYTPTLRSIALQSLGGSQLDPHDISRMVTLRSSNLAMRKISEKPGGFLSGPLEKIQKK